MFVRLLVIGAVAACPANTALAGKSDYLQLGIGVYDVTDGDAVALEGYGEYRFGRRIARDLAGDWWHGVGPLVGLKANADGGVFGYADAFLDIRPYEDVVIWPSAGIGGWRQGNSRDLGGTFQFHTEMFVGYRLAARHMLGISFQHVSNAGLHRTNPGANSIFVTYSIALAPVF